MRVERWPHVRIPAASECVLSTGLTALCGHLLLLLYSAGVQSGGKRHVLGQSSRCFGEGGHIVCCWVDATLLGPREAGREGVREGIREE